MIESKAIKSSNKKIAKNTFYLYTRTFFSIIVTLYTSRVFLNQLGIEDYGIYNLVGGVVALFGVLNTMLASATQRFLSIEIGKGEKGNIDKILNVSLIIHLALAILFILLGEIGGSILLYNFLNIPVGKENVAYIVFHLSMLTAAVSLMKTPYNALIVAKERMAFYAYMSILEVAAKLFITMILIFCSSKLIVYSLLLLVINIVLNICYYTYSKLKIGLSKIKVYKIKETPEYKSLLSFSTWSLLGNASSVGRDQGFSFLLNNFFGVTLNAAMGIMVQISNVYSSLFLNLQSAFRPQVIQNSIQDRERYLLLLNRCTFYSLFFMGLVCLPMILSCKYVLKLWLGQVPCYTTEFVQLLMFKILLASVSQSIFISLEAHARIKVVQIATTCLSFMTLLISYYILYLGVEPFGIMVTLVLMEALMLLIRLFVANYYKCLEILAIVKFVGWTLLITVMLMLLAFYIANYINTLTFALFSIPLSIVVYMTCVGVVMNKNERVAIMGIIKNKFNKKVCL